jgi:hypothetical protein
VFSSQEFKEFKEFKEFSVATAPGLQAKKHLLKGLP